MKRIVIAFCLGIISLAAFSQKGTKVYSKDYTVEKIQRQGLATTIELDKKFVKKKWEKFIKDYGKIESKKNTFIINVANINSISSNAVKFYSAIESSGKGTQVWIAIDMGSKYVVEGGQGYSSAEKLLKDFGKACYRADVEEQVKEAEGALKVATKKQSKTIKEGETLSNNLESNAKEKQKLETAIENNAKQKEQLEKDIVQNGKDKEVAKGEFEKMKKALEIKQAELSKYN